MTDLLVFHDSELLNTQSAEATFEERHDELVKTSFQLLDHEIGFIFNREFETLAYEDVEAAGEQDGNFISPDVDTQSLSGLPPYIAALYSISLLTATGETALFRKMNFLKYWANVFRSGLDPDRPSAEVIDEIQVLLAEAERTRNQIIESNLRLVVSIARKFAKNSTSFDDLVSEGNVILAKAVEKFDYSRGFRFSTYVTHSVQRHIYRHLQRIQRRSRKELAVSEQMLDAAPEKTDDDATSFDTSEIDVLMSRMSETLDERELFIVCERFGLGKGAAARTFQSLSEDLGVCKERVRQLFHIALDKLRVLAIELNLDVAAA